MRTRSTAGFSAGLFIALLLVAIISRAQAPADARQPPSAEAASPFADLPPAIKEKLAKLQADVETARTTHDTGAEAKALNTLGDLYIRVSASQLALETYSKALTISEPRKITEQEAIALNGLGDGYRGLSQSDQALQSYQKALDLATSSGDLRNQAVALNGIGWMNVNTGKVQSGLEFHFKALAIAEKLGDLALQASILNRIGGVKDIEGDTNAATQFYGRALANWRTVGDHGGEAKTLNNIGILFSEIGNPKQALDYYNQALPLYHEAGDRAGEASVLNNIGVVYKHIGDGERAIESYQRVLRLQHALGNRAGEAAALNNLGNAYYAVGRNQEALKLFIQSRTIWKEIGNPEGEAGALHSIGEQWVVLGDMQKALETLEEALALWKASDNHRGEASTLNSLGIVYDWLGKPETAADYYLNALGMYKDVSDWAGEAGAASNLAGLMYAPGQKQKALYYYGLALTLQQSVDDKDGEARTLNNMGLVYDDLGQRQKAQENFEKALAMWREIGERNGEASALNNIGSLLDRTGEKEKARQYFAQALPLARSTSNPLQEAKIFHDLMLNEKEHEPALAVFYGKQAVNLVQHARGQMRGLEKGLQRGFLATMNDYYHDLAELLIAQGRLPEAQQVLDLLKDQEYDDYVRGEAEKSLNPLTMTPGEQQAREDYEKSTAQIVSLGEEWMRLKSNKARTPEEEKSYQELSVKLNDASKGLSDYYARLYTAFGNNPEANKEVADVKGNVSLLKRFLAKEPHTVALYTLVGKDRYSVIVITSATAVAREFPVAAVDLNKKVADFQQALRDRARDPKPLAAELYKILIGPAAADLEQTKADTLVWALDGVLRYVPMDALYDGKKFVVERYSTVTITPASIPHLTTAPNMTNLTAVGMGISQKFEEGLPALPSVATELNEVIQNDKSGATRGAMPGTILLNADFTEKAMESLLERQVSVVHIASHFVFKPGDDSQSYLLLAGKDQDKAGFHLTVADFRDDQRISLDDTELLTLSACETGMSGAASNGREIDGLGTTAQLKGARAVISSLWEVNDASTGVLMADFYKRWVNGAGKVTKAEALRQAQLDLLGGKINAQASPDDRGLSAEGNSASGKSAASGYAHPYYWAPFVLMGNWR